MSDQPNTLFAGGNPPQSDAEVEADLRRKFEQAQAKEAEAAQQEHRQPEQGQQSSPTNVPTTAAPAPVPPEAEDERAPWEPAESPPLPAVGFRSDAALPDLASGVGALAQVAREEAEVKGLMILAHRFPRIEAEAHAKLQESCQRPSFAESAAYAFPRGGTLVKGPSVDLAREAARCWKNLYYGLRIVEATDDWVHIKGFCLDLENAQYVEAEDKFRKLIYRKSGGWQTPDERDLRELVNRRGAICVRNAILQVLPPDMIDEAMRKADETLQAAADGKIQGQSRTESIRRLVIAFTSLGVTVEMIANKLGHSPDAMTPQQIAEFRGIYKALADNTAKREEFFEVAAKPSPDAAGPAGQAQAASQAKTEQLKNRISQQRAKRK